MNEHNKENQIPGTITTSEMESLINLLNDKLMPVLSEDVIQSNRQLDLIKKRTILEDRWIQSNEAVNVELQKEHMAEVSYNKAVILDNAVSRVMSRAKTAIGLNALNDFNMEYQNRKVVIKTNGATSAITSKVKDKYIVEKVVGSNDMGELMDKMNTSYTDLDICYFGYNIDN
jgi:hypothetical protein